MCFQDKGTRDSPKIVQYTIRFRIIGDYVKMALLIFLVIFVDISLVIFVFIFLIDKISGMRDTQKRAMQRKIGADYSRPLAEIRKEQITLPVGILLDRKVTPIQIRDSAGSHIEVVGIRMIRGHIFRIRL